MDDLDDIYYMGLHDIVIIANIFVLRVPGGWIYEFFRDESDDNPDSRQVFVPFHNEFCGSGNMLEEVKSQIS